MSVWPTQILIHQLKSGSSLASVPSDLPLPISEQFLLHFRHTHTHTTTIIGHIPNPSRGYSLCLTLPKSPRYSKIPSNGLPRARGMASQRWRVTSATDHCPCPPQDCRLRIDGRLRRPGAASSTPGRFGTMSWMPHPGIYPLVN